MKKTIKRISCLWIALLLLLGVISNIGIFTAEAKMTTSAGAENVFFYTTGSNQKQVLLSVIPLAELKKLQHGQLSDLLYGEQTGANYYISNTDNYPAMQYCEAKGITLMELLEYVKGITSAAGASKLTFSGDDTMKFMAADSYGNYTRSWTYK